VSETNKAVGIAGVLGALATSATAAAKRAATDPLKNANNNERYGAFKKTPDRWRVATTTEWGGDRSMESELTTVIRDADPSQWPALEKNLLKVLANKQCTDKARDWVCRMLRLIGSPACVPALSKMLVDPKQADKARYALELIPGAEVDTALQAALGKLNGPAKTGLQGTIAARKQFGA
jgi:hypothetical protein